MVSTSLQDKVVILSEQRGDVDTVKNGTVHARAGPRILREGGDVVSNFQANDINEGCP